MSATSRAASRAASAALLALGPCVAACSGPAPGPEGALAAESAIIGGSKDAGDPAVVMLASYPPDHTTLDTCTASFISGDVLITAAHCLDPATHPSYSFGVFLGPDASAYATANTLIPKLTAVKEVHLHPDYDPFPPFHADIGVVVLEQPAGISPLPVQREPITIDWVGRAARIVGYGQITYKQYNAVRYEASTVVASVETDDTIAVGDLDRRSCVGDSGGPALVMIDGEERVVGVDSYTDLAGCLEPAFYRRPDLYTAFLDIYAPPQSSSSSSSSGGGGAHGDIMPGSGSDGCAITAPSTFESWSGWMAALALCAFVRRAIKAR